MHTYTNTGRNMPLSNIDYALPDPDTYKICINNFQREVFMKALKHALHTMPNDMWLNADQKQTADDLYDMLNPNGSVAPLCTKGINLFVL